MGNGAGGNVLALSRALGVSDRAVHVLILERFLQLHVVLVFQLHAQHVLVTIALTISWVAE